MFEFGKKGSVDSIIQTFNKTIEDLLNLSQDKKQQAEDTNKQIAQLEVEHDEAVKESERAVKIADNLSKVFDL